MRKRFLFLRLYEHLAYCGLLLLAFWYFQQKEKEQEQVQEVGAHLVPLATKAITRFRHTQWDELQHSASSNPIRPILKHRRSAENISELAKSLAQQLESAAQRSYPNVEYETLVRLTAAVQALGDTIRQNTRPDTGMANWVKAVLRGADVLLQTWPDTCSDAERAQFCRYLQLRVAVLESGALTYFKEQIDALEPEWAVVPQLSLRISSCPVVGDLFDADIFASLYKKHDLVHTATINGKEYPVENGLVRFRKRFSASGRHILDVKFTLQSEEEGAEPKYYSRDFEVQVCPR
jgi:hypothetical protein